MFPKYRCLGIGFGFDSAPMDERPGLNPASWGYHSEDGDIFYDAGRVMRDAAAHLYGTGDCVGCCVDTTQRTAFFTHNGERIGQ